MIRHSKRSCPHCDRELYISNYYSHVRSCPYNPTIKALILDKVKALAEGNKMPSQRDWELYRDDLPGTWTICATFGSWNGFAEWLGYEPNPAGGQERERIPKYDPTKTGTVSVEEMDETLPGGLPVCKVHEDGSAIHYLLR